jgi:transcriptional regulator with XRE-family HTH domain
MAEVEDMKDRLRKLRKALDMTQGAFAKRLGLSDSALSRIEIGDNTLSDNNILLICTPNRMKEGYTVNEEWLRNGGDDKDMFKAPPPDNVRPKLYDKDNQELPIEEEELIGIYRKLEPPNKKAVMAAADALLDSQGKAEKGERRADTSKESV